MKRIVNLRCFLVVALYVILTIFSCLLAKNVGIAGYILFYGLLLSAIVFFIVSLILSEKKIFRLTFVLSFLFSIFTLISFNGITSTWTIPIQEDKTYTIEATVDVNGFEDRLGLSEDIIHNGGINGIVIQNLMIDGKKVSGKMLVSLNDYESKISLIRNGYKVKFQSKIYTIDLIDGAKVNGINYRNNIRYRVYAPVSSLLFTPADATWNNKFLSDVYDTLLLNMGSNYGSIAFSMLTGDKNYLADSVSNIFSASGLGHIMAVSGLHIGFLTVLLQFLFKKLHVPRLVYIFVIAGILGLYAFLVGFSPSVLRAVIMSLVGLVTFVNGKRKDMLTSLCVAVAFILVVAPFFLFEAGFVLSVCAVFGLILFATPFEKALRKIHCPKKLASAVAVSSAVQIGIIPAMAYFFNQIQLYSVFVNILLMWLIMVTFMAILVTLPIAMLIPFFSILLQIAGIGIAVISGVAEFVSSLPYSSILAPSFLGVFICYIFYFIGSRFIMLPRFKKITSATVAAICCCLLVIPALTISVNINKVQYTLLPCGANREVTTLMVDGNNKVSVVGDMTNVYSLKQRLLKLGATRIENLFLHEMNDAVANELVKLSKLFPIRKIYCTASEIKGGISILIENRIDNFFAFEEAANSVPNWSSVVKNNKTIGYKFYDGEIGILFLRYSSTAKDVAIDVVNACAIIRSYKYDGLYSERIYLTNMPKNYLDLGEPMVQLTLDDFSEAVFNYKQGKVLSF